MLVMRILFRFPSGKSISSIIKTMFLRQKLNMSRIKMTFQEPRSGILLTRQLFATQMTKHTETIQNIFMSYKRQFCFHFFFFNLFFWLCWVFVSVRGLSLVAASGGPLFIAVRGPLTIMASPVAEHRLQTRRLSSCGPRAQVPGSTWDPPRPGPEPMSPALAGRLPTTAPPGKPCFHFYIMF